MFFIDINITGLVKGSNSNGKSTEPSAPALSMTMDNDPFSFEITDTTQEFSEYLGVNVQGSSRQKILFIDDISDEEISKSFISSLEGRYKVNLVKKVSKSETKIQCVKQTHLELPERKEEFFNNETKLEEDTQIYNQCIMDLKFSGADPQDVAIDLYQKSKVNSLIRVLFCVFFLEFPIIEQGKI